MEYITTTLSNLLQQTAFLNLTFGNIVMIFVALIFLYLAIGKGFEPLLLLPISFGMLLVNIYPDIMRSIEDSSNGVGGLLHYFYLLDEWSILPSLIFMGVGAMTDFGPLIANPKSFLLGAAAQFGIYGAYFMAIFMGFNDKAAAAISIIGGADGPTSIFLGTSVGATTSAEAFLNLDTIKIVVLGLIAFALGTAAGVIFGKIMCKVTHGKVNPLIGSAGVSAVPMAARVSQKVGSEADPSNFLLMHAMGPNVAGVIGTAVAAGTFMAIFGVK